MRTRRSTSSGDPVTRINVHRSVLLQESIDSLQIKESDVVIDATLGGAGHAAAISMKLGAQGTLIGFDLDRDAIERARGVLGESICKKIFVEANFRDLGSELAKLDIHNIDKALFDLGWSSFQLEAGRGFSFQKDEPLLMTYTKAGTGLTADIIVNTWAEGSIADVLYGWGEERYARRIAKRRRLTTSQRRPDSSWNPSAPAGTSTVLIHAARVIATGKEMPASCAVLDTSTRVPSSIASALV